MVFCQRRLIADRADVAATGTSKLSYRLPQAPLTCSDTAFKARLRLLSRLRSRSGARTSCPTEGTSSPMLRSSTAPIVSPWLLGCQSTVRAGECSFPLSEPDWVVSGSHLTRSRSRPRCVSLRSITFGGIVMPPRQGASRCTAGACPSAQESNRRPSSPTSAPPTGDSRRQLPCLLSMGVSGGVRPDGALGVGLDTYPDINPHQSAPFQVVGPVQNTWTAATDLLGLSYGGRVG
jgi:hypothetical protein